VLSNPMVDAAVLETARGGILREGLGFDRCDVAVVTNIGSGDHLGLAGIDTPEQLAVVKRCIVEAVGPQGTAVLKADDPLTAAMIEKCKGKVTYFCIDGEHKVVVDHRQHGGKAVYVEDGMIMAAEGDLEEPIMPVAAVPLTHGGRIGFQIENTLAAVAAAWALGLPRETIRAGLETFGSDMDKVPGRFNLLDIGGATVIIDYGHNPSSLKSMVTAMDSFPHERRIAVYSAAGDRRDIDLIEQGEQLGDAFDHVVIYEDHYLRGRQPGEIIRLFREGVAKGSRCQQVSEITGSVKALEAALKVAKPGDLLLLQADTIDETMEFIRKYLEAAKNSGREITIADALNQISQVIAYATEVD